MKLTIRKRGTLGFFLMMCIVMLITPNIVFGEEPLDSDIENAETNTNLVLSKEEQKKSPRITANFSMLLHGVGKAYGIQNDLAIMSTYVFESPQGIKVDFNDMSYYAGLSYTVYQATTNAQGKFTVGSALQSNISIGYNEVLDLSGYAEGTYIILFKSYMIVGDVDVYDSGHALINIERVSATVDVNGPHGNINPDNLEVGASKGHATSNWVIKDSNNKVVASYEDNDDLTTILNTLPEGEYTLSNIATITSKLGNEIESEEVSKDFIIRHPESSTTVDKNVNPEVITGTQKIEDSTLTWVIKDSNNKIIDSGTGSTIPNNIIKDLEDGSYKVEFTETSPEGETHTSNGSFIIRYPKSETNVDKPYNPDSVTGEQKLDDSTLSWEIKDSNGVVIESGTGNTISDNILHNLQEGNYTVEFTETSTEGESHASTGSFIIRHPETSITIDNTTNPDTIVGEQKIPDSELTWVIKDENGSIVANGTGNTVPKEIIDQLDNGDYIVEFTETSPENETHTSIAEFTINKNNSVKEDTGSSTNNKKVTVSVDKGLVHTSDDIFNKIPMYTVVMIMCVGLYYCFKRKKTSTSHI
ncbi:MAG: hypothetical protein ACK5LC_12025 [Coprobacillaceae bacterium]